MLPFQKIDISDMPKYLDEQGGLHSVISICGFLLCTKGWVKVRLNDYTYTINQGDMYIYVSSTFLHVLSWSKDLEGIVFRSSLDYVLPFVERAAAQQSILNIRSKPCTTLTAEQQASILELSNLLDKKMQLYAQNTTDDAPRKFMIRELECLSEALFTELFLYYTSSQSKQLGIHNNKDRIVQQFISCLFKNHKREREVKYYAEQQYLTPRYFSTIVKERTGKTALNWISEMVISSACQMLAYSNLSVKEIAIEMNFPTQTFFGKYFKQYMHCSPLQYRQKHQQTIEQDKIKKGTTSDN